MNILPRLRRAALTLATGLCLCGPALAQSVTGSGPAPLGGTVALDPTLLVRLLVSRSAEIEYSRLQIDIAGQLSAAEAALYETIFFSSLRHEERERQRTVEERLASLATSSVPVLDERVSTAQAGVRNRLPGGGEMALSYQLRDKHNNIIAQSGPGTEYDGALTLTFKQPLLRGRGSAVAETDWRVAEAEHRIATQQYRQQLLKTCSDALLVYWQLYRALEVRRIRAQALDYARRVEADTGARIAAGKLPSSNAIEAGAAVLLREVEQIRSEQGVQEAQARLRSLLNVSGLEQAQPLELLARADAPAALEARAPEQRYRAALENWPALRIAELRAEQARLRLNFAANQRLPALDLVLTRSNTGLANDNKMARSSTEAGHYPEWTVGLNLEVPLQGNRKAQAQYNAQAARLRQAGIEIESIRTTLANDIGLRSEQAAAAGQEMRRMERDAALRAELLRIEQVRYDAGIGLLSALLQRESELSESRQRLVESTTRLGQANDALRQADGSLLREYGITLKD